MVELFPILLTRKPEQRYPMQQAVMPPEGSNQVTRSDVLSTGALLLFLFAWHWRVTGSLTLAAAGALALFISLCLAYGVLFIRFVAPIYQSTSGIAFQFMSGYFVFNSLLFIACLATPFGMETNLAGLAGLAVAGLVITRRRVLTVSTNVPYDRWATLAAICLSGIGATIWCSDAQMPLQLQSNNLIFHVWPDVFIHAREISVFAQAHGLATVHDIKLAGGHAPIYHFASYLSPAAISSLSGASAMQVYASFQLPLGIFFTGLAAYCLASKCFGSWPGVAAVVAIVLFPDAFQQGLQNRYLSYNFLAQVNLGLLYGIACITLAWTFMFDGCQRGRVGSVLLAFGFLIICLFYKAHIFVANSYILMVFPIIFFKPLRTRWRIVLGVLATIVFCIVVSYSQTNPRIPVMRLDGSGIGSYLSNLLHDYDAGWMKQTFTRIFKEEQHGKAMQTLYAVAMLLVSTFGVWLLGLAIVLVAGWRNLPSVYRWFPIIVIVNYLVMTLGLALDSRSVGTPDELINRPLVWAYFAVAVSSAALAYRLLVGDGLPKSRAWKGVMLASVLACAVLTIRNAPNLQTFPARAYNNFTDFAAVPECLVQAASHLRNAGADGDIVQDSVGDPRFILTALSERQLYVGKVSFGGQNVEQELRLANVKVLERFSNSHQLLQFAKEKGIDWYLQYPDYSLAWPASIIRQPAFSCGGYRLFRFAQHAPGSTLNVKTSSIGGDKDFQ